jgi:hypothetical protein
MFVLNDADTGDSVRNPCTGSFQLWVWDSWTSSMRAESSASNSRIRARLSAVQPPAVEDVAWGTLIYRNAVERCIGVKLSLWDQR